MGTMDKEGQTYFCHHCNGGLGQKSTRAGTWWIMHVHHQFHCGEVGAMDKRGCVVIVIVMGDESESQPGQGHGQHMSSSVLLWWKQERMGYGWGTYLGGT